LNPPKEEWGMNMTQNSSLADQEMSVLPSTIVETCLYVENLNRSRKFYADLFGYSVMKFDERFCAFDVGNHQVLLLFVRGSDPEGTVLPFGMIPAHGTSGQAHLGFGVPSVSLPAWTKRLEQQGIAIESSLTWPEAGTSIYFRDPDGHLLELLTPGVWPNY
jgi:catechol 2,3-dioxygenase-like lactoylglutathione lyase family enzyme